MILRALRRFTPDTTQILFFAAMLGEVLCLTLAFDGEQLAQTRSQWALLIAAAPAYLRIAVAGAGVALLLAGPASLKQCLDGPRWRAGARAPFLVLHAGVFASFWFITFIVFNRFATLNHQAAWAAAWFSTGLLTLLSWALAVFPLDHWVQSAYRLRRSILGGLVGGALVWAGGTASRTLWTPLASYTFAFVTWMLQLMYSNAVSDPSKLIVGVGRFKVNIAPECSGFEGIGLILAFISLYLWMSRKDLRFPGALALLPIGAAAIWVANALRIVALVVIGVSGWPGIARGGFHSQAGWLAFNAVALGLAALTTRSGYFASSRQETLRPRRNDGAKRKRGSEQGPDQRGSGHYGEHPSTPAYVAPLAAVLVVSMITGAFSAGFDWLYPVRVFAAAAVLWVFRHRYRRLKWSWSPASLAFGVAGFFAWVALMPASASASGIGFSALKTVPAAGATAWLVMRIAGYVVTVPIVEELAFRAFLSRRLIRADFENVPLGAFTWGSFLMASAVFGAFHGIFWLPATVAGMIFAVALYRTGSIGDAVQAHATTNALIVLYVFWTGRSFMWS